MAESTNLRVALDHAAAGLFVFPARVSFNSVTGRWGKQPCISGWQTKATRDPIIVREFWRQFPNAVPGLALGRSGLVVLDADRHGGPDGVSAFRDLVARHGLPDGVVRVDTPGAGEHWVFFNLPDDPLGNCEGVLPGGINMRGRGGFIVAPGSIRPDGKRWIEPERGPKLVTAYPAGIIPQIPPWIVDLIRGPKPDPSLHRSQPTQVELPIRSPTARERAYALSALEIERARVAQASTGTRNETLNRAAFASGQLVGVGWIEADVVEAQLLAAAQACGLVRDDGLRATRSTIDSGLKAGIAEPRPALPEGGFGTIDTIGTAALNVWSEPDLSYAGSGRSDAVSFPTELLGPFWGDWCSAHGRARCVPVDYVAAALLVGASALIGNARWTQATPEWTEPSVLWGGAVGSPSTGKSPGHDPVLCILRQIEKEAIEAVRPEREAYEEAVKLANAHEDDWTTKVKTALKNGDVPPPRPAGVVEPDPIPLPRIVMGDTTPEKVGTLLRDNLKGLLLYRDEIAGWIGSFGRYSSSGSSERAMWIEAYGGRPYTIDRQRAPEPIVVPHLSIPVLGGVQPDKLHLITGGADDGFAARFLWFWPDPVRGFRLACEPVASSLQQEALRRLHRLRMMQTEDRGLQPSYVPLSQAAAAPFEQYVREVKERGLTASGVLEGAFGKVPGQVLRLALILEYLSWCEDGSKPEPSRFGETAMLAAIGLVDGYFLPMARRVFGEAAIPEEDRRAMVLARWILENKPTRFNARETRRRPSSPLRNSTAMTRACEVLIQAGWIRPVVRASGSGGGRTPSDYEVNPVLIAR